MRFQTIVALLCSVAVAAEDGGPAGDHFRTEADDRADLPADDLPQGLPSLGAVAVPVSCASPVQASVGLYTPQGRLVRILAQAVRLPAGTSTLRWDGLDLFGNPVPVGSPLELRVFTTAGITATYLTTVGAGDPARPWGGVSGGPGLEQRCGGWLGDHSAPNCAATVGDHILLGCALAEFGHNLILVDRQGEKVWGLGLQGWTGPVALASDGHLAFAVPKGGRSVEVFEPLTLVKGGPKRLPAIAGGADRITAIAAHAGTLTIAARNHLLDEDPFRPSSPGVDHARCLPQVLDGKAPTEFMVSPKEAFALTFIGGGNPQAGVHLVVRKGRAYLVAAFRKPAEVGSLVLAGARDCGALQVYALKSGVAFDEMRHAPLGGKAASGPVAAAEALGDDAGGDDLELDPLETNPDWQALGTVSRIDGFALLGLARPITTAALAVSVAPPGKRAASNWKPFLRLLRPCALGMSALPPPARVAVPTEAIASPVVEGRSGWSFTMPERISAWRPADVVLSWPEAVEADGLLLLDPQMPDLDLAVWAGAGTPDAAAATGWTPVGRFSGGNDKKLGALTAGTADNVRLVRFDERQTFSALRLRHTAGYRTGKWAQGRAEDPRAAACGSVALLRLTECRVLPPATLLRRLKADDRSEQTAASLDGAVSALAQGPDGALFAVVGRDLCRLDLEGGAATSRVLSAGLLSEGGSLAVTGDRILVGDRARDVVHILDREGRPVGRIGRDDQRPRRPGPWVREQVMNPAGIAVDSSGQVWVAEDGFSPKRVSRFRLDGTFIAEHLGPPMYGGGGSLDPDLRSFYYSSQRFSLDLTSGASSLAMKYDTYLDPASPALEGSSFSYTGLHQVTRHAGRRYLFGGGDGGMAIGVLADGDGPLRPVAVLAPALGNPFLGKEVWREHFDRLDLVGAMVIWCDANDDGQYQPAEVEVVRPADWQALGGSGRIPCGGTMGPGLTLWAGNGRLAPSGFTAGGTPLYRFRDWKPWSVEGLAPHYRANYTLGGPQSAKPAWSGWRHVTASGRAMVEGQPWVVGADGGLVGGAWAVKPSGYVPAIPGTILNQPMGCAGSTCSASPVGEVALVQSNNGYWYVWGVEQGMILATVFDGTQGQWDAGVPAVAGTDVTHRKHHWEAWGGDFLRADDGKCYASAGKGWHAVCRLDGLDAFTVGTQAMTVEAAPAQTNARLRPVLVERAAARAAKPRTAGVAKLAARTKGFALDGKLGDWGSPTRFTEFGPASTGTAFALAQDEKGLVLALRGCDVLGAGAAAPDTAHRDGFCIDLRWRRQRGGGEPQPGDRRLVLARIGGAWTPVLHVLRDPAVAQPDLAPASPYGVFRVDRCAVAGPEAVALAMQVDPIDLDLGSAAGGGEVGDVMEELTGRDMAGATRRKRAKGESPWSLELRLPWSTLGVDKPSAVGLAFEIGVRAADGARRWWADPATTDLADPGLSLLPNLGAEGVLAEEAAKP